MPRTGVDYADYSITVYRSCPYGCLYCYVWRNRLFVSRVTRGKYNPVIEAEKIAKKCRNRERVVISFTSDPYPPEEGWKNLTRNVIYALRKNGCPTVMILTKNPLLALKDQDVMYAYMDAPCYAETWVGTTIVSADISRPYSIILEPNAPRTDIRLYAMQEFQRTKAQLWLSIEPIIPVEDIWDFHPEAIVTKIINRLDPDHIKLVVLGRLNYMSILRKQEPFNQLLPSEKEARQFYKEHVPIAVDILKEHGISFHIKRELARVIRND